jgi:glycosyltransferase involved in cell wall biosynthesis
MRILYFINGFFPGGKERRLMELIKYVRAKSLADVELVVMSCEIRYPQILELGINVHFLIRRTKKDVRIFHQFFRLCKALDPDIIHTWDSMTSVYAAPVAKLLGIKFINGMIVGAPPAVTPMTSGWLRSRFTYLFSDAVVANSNAGLRAYKAPAGKSICIYNGFNNDRINEMPDRESVRRDLGIETPRVVGMVASFNDMKDYDTYLLAAQKILATRGDVTFLAIGDGERLERCKTLVMLQYQGKIRFLGWQAKVESIINVMDIGVLSSHTEGLSNSILEYMALGKPVVATDVGGTPEIVIDGVTGFLVAHKDLVQLAAKILHLLDNPDQAQEMGEQGKRRVAEVFAIEKMVAGYMELYERLYPKGVIE